MSMGSVDMVEEIVPYYEMDISAFYESNLNNSNRGPTYD
jgi:hypothetical protein